MRKREYVIKSCRKSDIDMLSDAFGTLAIDNTLGVCGPTTVGSSATNGSLRRGNPILTGGFGRMPFGTFGFLPPPPPPPPPSPPPPPPPPSPPPPPGQNQRPVPFWFRATMYYSIYMIVSCSLCCAFSMSFDLGDDSGGRAAHSPTSAPPPVIASAPAPSLSYRVVSSIYFVVVSMYTIGYGDVTPVTPATKAMVLLIDLLSFGFISVLTNQVIDDIIHRLEACMENLDDDRRIRRRTTVAVLIVLSGILVGYGWMQYFYKEISRLDSIYLVLITLTSIGYGDRFFKSATQRWFAIFWIAFYMPVFERAAKYLVGRFLTWARPYEHCFWIRLSGWWFGAHVQQQNVPVPV